MARVKRGTTVRRRHKKILNLTKGYKLGRSKLFRQAKQAMLKAGEHAYRDRRNKKRDFRRLWIVQVNAALKLHEISYSQFIYGLDKAGLNFNRKVLAQLSIESPKQFEEIVAKVKEALKKI